MKKKNRKNCHCATDVPSHHTHTYQPIQSIQNRRATEHLHVHKTHKTYTEKIEKNRNDHPNRIVCVRLIYSPSLLTVQYHCAEASSQQQSLCIFLFLLVAWMPVSSIIHRSFLFTYTQTHIHRRRTDRQRDMCAHRVKWHLRSLSKS